ncbi:LuxR C-terminal-related transcriptional regulator [Streptomyces sp. NPDC018584]|uniref:LuxR C-terminal-related transcriptional regulator n=1 Tax=unclassified Streptomyces TaxID=2593676 RepID=UPI00378F41D8
MSVVAVHKARGLVRRPLEPRSAVTRRQVGILRLAANGNTNRAIARWLGISEETVKSQLKAVYPKLRVSDRTQAVAVALRVGLLTVDDIDLPPGLVGRPGQRHT